jgi:hypothetical protein
MTARRCDVLLLSAAPEMFTPLLDSLASSGIAATAACSPRDATRLIMRRPLTVLVDLVHGTGLDADAVAAINKRQGRTMVLALHDGNLGLFTEPVWELNVDGFCRFDDWGPIVRVTPPRQGTFALH